MHHCKGGNTETLVCKPIENKTCGNFGNFGKSGNSANSASRQSRQIRQWVPLSRASVEDGTAWGDDVKRGLASLLRPGRAPATA